MSIFLIALVVFIFIRNWLIKDKSSDNSKTTINVYNWGEYISDGTDNTLNVNKEFTKLTGIEVNYTTFQSNEELFAKLSSGGSDYDVIIPSDYMVSRLIENNMLAKIDFNNVSNFSLIDDEFVYPEYDPTNEYSVPYTWGMVGIFYNKTMVDEPYDEIDFNILWNPKYKGKILMFDNSRDSFGISLITLNKSVNSINPDDWYAAAEHLKTQKKLVQAYVMDQIFDKMGNGEAAIAPYYSGNAVILMKNNPSIDFVIPKSGSTRFVDAMCIPASSSHKREAEEYINFMCSTKIAKANIEYIGYSTPQKEVKQQLDPSISQNKIYYPDSDVIENSEVFVNLPPSISSLSDSLWIDVKTGGENNPLMLIAVILAFLIFYIFVIIYKKKKSSKEI